MMSRGECESVVDLLWLEPYQTAWVSPGLFSIAELRDAVLYIDTCREAGSAQAWERQLLVQSWERCQQQLFLSALQPHPLTTAVLGSVWGDLAACSSPALLKSHITGLHDLLRMAAAVEAAATEGGGGGGPGPPSPLLTHLLRLLAAVLSAAPSATQEAYHAAFLQASAIGSSWWGAAP